METLPGLAARGRRRVLARADGIDELLSAWADAGIVTARLRTDDYLATSAILSDLRLATFDDFRWFPGLDLLQL